MKKNLLIIGAGGHGKVVADIALKMNFWKSIFFLDDNENIKNTLGIRVLGKSENIINYIEEYDIFVAVGNNSIREKLHKKIENAGGSIPTLIHPKAVIGKGVEIGDGTVVMAGAIINPCTKIGKGCIINTGSTIDHDNVIGDFVHISPGCHLAGFVTVGNRCWLGIGSIVANNLSITSDCQVGAGGVVITNLNEPGVYIGIPVRRYSK